VHTIDVLGARKRAKLRAGRDDQRVIADPAISHVHDLACNVHTRCRLAEKKHYVEFGEYVVAAEERNPRYDTGFRSFEELFGQRWSVIR
jgi:hypothetical protein